MKTHMAVPDAVRDQGTQRGEVLREPERSGTRGQTPRIRIARGWRDLPDWPDGTPTAPPTVAIARGSVISPYRDTITDGVLESPR